MHNDPIQPYPIPAISAYTVSGTLFKETQKLRKVNNDFDGKIFGMSKRRRQQFPAIATVVESLIAAVPDIRTATFCGGGNREGALLMILPKEERNARLVSLLHQSGKQASDEVIHSVIASMLSASPIDIQGPNISSVFNLGLGPLFVSKIWARFGEPAEANAAYELHRAIAEHPSLPGLTHLARAILGLTLCARWGSNLGPVDQELHKNLRKLVFDESPEAIFWADYFGAVASVLTMICPAEPKAAGELQKAVK
jgi:retrograde regulation protein 2